MGHTNTTPNYNLPQFLGSDKPAWLTDVNNAMSAIDTAIAAAKAAADNAGGAAAALATTVGGHTTQLETLSNTVTNQGASIVSQGNAINTISELIGNGTPTTTDHTLIGAINELNAKEGNLADLQTTDKSSLVAAINEAAQGGGGGGSVQHKTVTGTTNASGLLTINTSDLDPSTMTVLACIPKRSYSGAHPGFYTVSLGTTSDDTQYVAAAANVATPVASELIAFEAYYI